MKMRQDGQGILQVALYDLIVVKRCHGDLEEGFDDNEGRDLTLTKYSKTTSMANQLHYNIQFLSVPVIVPIRVIEEVWEGCGANS